MKRNARKPRRKPAATTTLFSLTKTCGTFNVGTLKQHRKHGDATTLIVHALTDSINEGNNLHTLQTTKGGNAEQLYKKFGFKTPYTVSYYVKKL